MNLSRFAACFACRSLRIPLLDGFHRQAKMPLWDESALDPARH